jgi:DeoR/GlpR family transcriptional regulator of sugar metabolism
MLTAQRRKKILELTETRSSITVNELCDLLHVSDMTIRRDLRVLANDRLLERVHGGALSQRGRSYEPPYVIRTTKFVKQKELIGRCATQFIKEGDSLGLDVGTTTLELAKAMIGIPNLTVVTASLSIAQVLRNAPNIRLILTGGILRKEEGSLIGHIAQRTFEEFKIDKAFVGIGGFHLSVGLTEYNLEDALVKKAMIPSAHQIIVLADSSKLEETCFTFVAPLSLVDILVTDEGAPVEVVDTLTSQGIQVVIAR